MYIIHSCNKRKQYVLEYIVPSMLKQGIKENEIIVFNDDDNKGCLCSWVESCKFLNENYKGIGFWHLQDDIVIADGFHERTKALESKMPHSIINGFVCKKHNPYDYNCIGWQNMNKNWMSFQCAYMPSEYIENFLSWFLQEVVKNGKYRRYYERNRHADFFFYKSAQIGFPKEKLYNVFPCLVDHVDYLLGGSVITENKKYIRQAEYWKEERGVLKK